MMNKAMKILAKVLTIMVVSVGIGVTGGWYFSSDGPENTITDYARIGIEAGLNAAIVKGKPTNRAELDDARDYARQLVEKMYPDIKFKWPALQKPTLKQNVDYASI